MTTDEMQNNGTIDYFLDLNKYINEFVNRNYPLTKEDMASIISDKPTENVKKRNEVYSILKEALDEVLEGIADKNNQWMNLAKRGILVKVGSVKEFQEEIFEAKQKLLEILWKKQHPEEQLQNKKIDENQERKTEQSERN